MARDGFRGEAAGTAAADGTRELILDGRRYRLVPVDDDDDALQAVQGDAAVDLLTVREREIASLVAEGFVNKEIAMTLHISEWTVATHLRRIFAKLGVETRAAMVHRCAGVFARRERDC